MIRVFLALEISSHAKEKLLEIRKSICNDDINYKWENVEKLHVTLKFVGDINEEYLPAIKEDLDFLTEYSGINGTIDKFGFFFRNGIASILWASLKLDPQINEIVQKLEDTFVKYDVEKEKRTFKPHLTLLRIKKDPGKHFINKFKEFNFEPINFHSDKITLFKSELSKSGSKYFEIKTYHLN